MSLDLTLKNREFNFKVTNLRDHRVYEFENFRLDAATLLLYRSGEQVVLTPKAVETLIALIEGTGKVIGKEELIQKIWPNTIVEESNLAQYLHVLRKTLGETSDGKSYIETLKRRGYRFNGAVRVVKNINGLVSPTEDAENLETPNGQPVIVHSTSHRVERRGNVLEVAAWREDPNPFVESIEDQSASPVASGYDYRRYLAAACAIIGVVVIAAFAFSRLTATNASVDRETVKSDLTILPLTNAEVVGQAAISPDGKYFAYTETDTDTSRIWLQTVGESSRVEVVGTQPDLIQNLTFTPDSTAIYFTGSNRKSKLDSLYRVAALGGVPTKIATNLTGAVSFSPGGDQIVFVRYESVAGQTQIITAASDGTGQRTLLTRTIPDFVRPNVAWSPDGKRIAFGLQNQEKSLTSCSMVAIEVATESIKPLSTEKWDSCHRSVWTRDGSGLVFIGTKFREALTTRRDQIYYLAVATGDARRLTNDGNLHEPMSLSITNEDEILAVPFNRVSQIWSLDTKSSVETARQITSGQSDGRGGIEAMPDGKIAFLSRVGDGFGIFLANIDGSEERRLLLTDQTMEELRAAPDGSFLVFAAKIGGYAHIFRADKDGTKRSQLTFGENNQVDSTISPDGKWIVFESSLFDGEKYQYSLQRISAEGGDAVQLIGSRCVAPHFSPDGKTISCIYGQNIRLVSAENGESLKTFEAADGAVLNNGARFAPDGKELVYRVLQKSGSNLWRQPIAGGDPRPLTDFTTGEIYNFAFAPDGLRIYLARGNQIRNAILIKNFK